MSRILSDEERTELRLLVEEALAHSLPTWADTVSGRIRSDLDDRLEKLGLAATDHEDRAEIRKDMEFIRSARLVTRSAATKLGGAIISTALLGAAAFAGYGAYLKGLFSGK